MRPSASLSSLAWRPESSVNTFRSTLPGRYGHGDGLVTKNLGKRNGALTRDPLLMVTRVFMRLVNAEEKTLGAAKRVNVGRCVELGRLIEQRALHFEAGGFESLDHIVDRRR